MFTIDDLLNLVEMSNLTADRQEFLKVNLSNLHGVYQSTYGEELIL